MNPTFPLGNLVVVQHKSDICGGGNGSDLRCHLFSEGRFAFVSIIIIIIIVIVITLVLILLLLL